MAGGRPTTYNEPQASEICERLAGGESLLSICSEPRMPAQSVVFQWLSKNAEFAENYARARVFWADSEFERIMEIADNTQEGVKTETDAKGGVKTIVGDMIEHRKLQVDTRKWALARMSPKKYGDRMENRLSGPEGEALKIVVTGIRPTEDNT